MNTKTRHLHYYANRAAFSTLQILGVVKRGRHLLHSIKGFSLLLKNVWYSLLSLWYSMRSYRGRNYAKEVQAMEEST